MNSGLKSFNLSEPQLTLKKKNSLIGNFAVYNKALEKSQIV